MLKRATQYDLKNIIAFCDGSVLGTRIICFAECYGFERNFAEFWLCCEDDENITAVIVRLGDDITVHGNGKPPSEELLLFLNMSRCKSLMSDIDLELDGYISQAKQAFVFTDDTPDTFCESLNEKDMPSVYRLISDNIPGSFAKDEEAYLSFLSDFTFRKLRGKARGKAVHSPEVVACALTSAETDKSALLSGIASDISARGTGAGKKVVLSLANELLQEGKQVFVIALNASACGFYKHIGFSEKEIIYCLKG